MKLFIFVLQLLGGLGPIRICDDAVGRANELALRLVLGADTFGATQGIDGEYRLRRPRSPRSDKPDGTRRMRCSLH